LFFLICARHIRALTQDKAEIEFESRTMSCGCKRAHALEKKMATGTVKFFNGQKGFGFIQQEQGGPDVFVHISAVERAGMSNLVEGQKLSFDIISERGKSAASNLQSI
jgi:cold shock protein